MLCVPEFCDKKLIHRPGMVWNRPGRREPGREQRKRQQEARTAGPDQAQNRASPRDPAFSGATRTSDSQWGSLGHHM